MRALDTSFKRLQRAVHPDFFGSAGASQQAASAAASSLLNVAYRTLRTPATRAQYLLRVLSRGATPGGAGASAPNDDSADADADADARGSASPELLAQVMAAREAVSDAATPTAELRALAARTQRACDACVRDLSAAFAAGDTERARAITRALSYYTKLVDEACEALEARGEAVPGDAAANAAR